MHSIHSDFESFRLYKQHHPESLSFTKRHRPRLLVTPLLFVVFIFVAQSDVIFVQIHCYSERDVVEVVFVGGRRDEVNREYPVARSHGMYVHHPAYAVTGEVL